MWDRCESCGRKINSAEECRLTTNDGVTIHTYCKECYEKSKQRRIN